MKLHDRGYLLVLSITEPGLAEALIKSVGLALGILYKNV